MRRSSGQRSPTASTEFRGAVAAGACVALLLSEVIGLTVSLDTQRLDTTSVWALPIALSPQVLRLAITVVSAIVLLGGRSLVRAVALAAGQRQPANRRPGFLGLHVLAVAAFAALSRNYFNAAHLPGLAAAAWMAAAATAAMAWVCALFPLHRWRELVHGHGALLGCALIVGSVAWSIGFVSDQAWAPLARYTYATVAWGLGLFYPHVISQPESLTLGTAAFAVEISPGCSGYEGIGLIVAFLSTYLFFFRDELRFPSALVLLPIGAATIWILNAARIIALVAIGSAGWPEVAAGGFHSQAGWLSFNAVGLAFVWLIRRKGYFTQDRHASASEARPAVDGTTPFVAPFLTLLAGAMLTGAISAGFDWLYPVRLAALAAVLWAFRKRYADLRWQVSSIGPACGAATFVVWMALLPHAQAGNQEWPRVLQSANVYIAAVWLAVRTIGYVAAVPVAEELVFRGYLTRRFWHHDADLAGIGVFRFGGLVLSSVLFGAFHGRLWLQATLAGLLFALAYYRRRSMGDAVLAHVTTNGLIASYVFVTGQWSVWS
jgi:exosortase E/protease (VPEID-CTERM system)